MEALGVGEIGVLDALAQLVVPLIEQARGIVAQRHRPDLRPARRRPAQPGRVGDGLLDDYEAAFERIAGRQRRAPRPARQPLERGERHLLRHRRAQRRHAVGEEHVPFPGAAIALRYRAEPVAERAALALGEGVIEGGENRAQPPEPDAEAVDRLGGRVAGAAGAPVQCAERAGEHLLQAITDGEVGGELRGCAGAGRRVHGAASGGIVRRVPAGPSCVGRSAVVAAPSRPRPRQAPCQRRGLRDRLPLRDHHAALPEQSFTGTPLV